jgi:hypothetical protein
MIRKAYPSRLAKCSDFNMYGVFGRDSMSEHSKLTPKGRPLIMCCSQYSHCAGGVRKTRIDSCSCSAKGSSSHQALRAG